MKLTRLIQLVLLVALAASFPQAVRAQLPWDSPQMLGPGAPAGASFIAAHYGLDPYSGLGGILILRTRPAPDGFGIRVSGASGFGDRINVGGGIDFTRALSKASAQFPLDLMLTYGAGASYGDFVEIALPVGIAGGRCVQLRENQVCPVHSGSCHRRRSSRSRPSQR
jgi:hypothetical protein